MTVVHTLGAALLAAAMAGCASPDAGPAMELNVASYNPRLDLASDGADAWPQRRETIRALVRRHGFDVLGTQEGLAHQIDDPARLPGYAVVVVGRDDGRRRGEHAAIFCRADRFERVAQGDFWLSEKPEPPSKGWDSTCCNRVASRVRLRERAPGREFVVFSGHFDHQGEVVRRESARLMLRKMREIAGDAAPVCVGDVNAIPSSEPIGIMAAALRDVRRVSATPPAGPIGTFNGFKPDAPLLECIDDIFVGAGWRARRYAALDDKHAGHWPSDPLPAIARLALD